MFNILLAIAKNNDALAIKKAELIKKATSPAPKVTITDPPKTESDSSSDEEYDTAADRRRKSDFDPTAEPTWLEDFGHNVSAKAEEAKERFLRHADILILLIFLVSKTTTRLSSNK